MCCIFTCCGWLIDLVQRCWTFTMSCCISSAVCCALITASMSGVALGYNYSLAEYIELKETNVSVYLKRGVFDDEVVDELDWRRSGGGPPAAKSEEQSVPPPDMSLRRSDSIFDISSTSTRIDESIYMAEERNKYEGSLMKLTAKPTIMQALVTYEPYAEPTVGSKQANNNGFPKDASVLDTIEDIKAVQSLINRRKMEETVSAPNYYQGAGYMSGNEKMSDVETIQNVINQRKQAAKKFATQRPTKIINNNPDARIYYDIFTTEKPPGDGRRMMGNDPSGTTELSDVMSLVRQQENQKPPKWWQPKPPSLKSKEDEWPLRVITTPRPGPLTLKPNPSTKAAVAPTRETFRDNRRMGYESDLGARGSEENMSGEGISGEIISKMNNNLPQSDKEYMNPSWKFLNSKDYSDEEIKGIPIRKKRSIRTVLNGMKLSQDESIKNSGNNINKKIEKENRQSLVDKLKAVINIITSVLSFAETVKSEVSKINATTLVYDTPKHTSPNVTTTGILITKIIKSSLVS